MAAILIINLIFLFLWLIMIASHFINYIHFLSLNNIISLLKTILNPKKYIIKYLLLLLIPKKYFLLFCHLYIR